MTIWICGTSVSIQAGGYSTYLQALSRSEPIRNISAGNQSSLMGLARVHSVVGEITSGDTVIWEYPLLDIILARAYGEHDLLRAMREAWDTIGNAGASVIVAVTIPKRDLAGPSEMENSIIDLATKMQLPIVTMRDVFADTGLSVDRLADHYKDDRHVLTNSELLPKFAKRLYEEITRPRRRTKKFSPWWTRSPLTPRWRWLSPNDLAPSPDDIEVISNRLATIPVVRLRPAGPVINVPDASRVIVGIAATKDAGALWCGHPQCSTATASYSGDMDFSFLLRITRLPCVRRRIDALRSAPSYAFQSGIWSDYGGVGKEHASDVLVFGALYDE